jgi:cell division protein FtsQ
MRQRMHLPMPPLPRRPPARAVAACAGVLVVLAGGWLWLRDSSLVAVRHVDVSGLSGSEAPRVRAALEAAARDMTTLHVRPGQLQTAVEPFPAIRSVEAHADFPHRLRVVVHEHVAVGAVTAGAEHVPVAADGTVLRGTSSGGLPIVAVGGASGGDTVSDRGTRRAIALLAAAPAALRAKVQRVYNGPRGLTAPLTDGPVLYFGGADRLRAKWMAATRVLADRSSAGDTYLDLRLPERPAAGGLEAPQQQQPDASPQVGAQPAQPQSTPVGP